MNIKILTDDDLHQNLLNLRSKESKVVAAIIAHLEEVFRRRLFSDYQCSSLYDYCIKILGYSNGEAHHRISACKLMSLHPEVKSLIENKELSLTNASLVQTFIAKNQLEGNKVIERIKKKSTRAAQIELDLIAKENLIENTKEKSTTRNFGDKTLVKVYLDRDSLELAKSRIKIQDTQEFLQQLVIEKLNATEPKLSIKPKLHKQNAKPRSLSLSKRAVIIKKANNQCELCQSKFNLEIDHKKPVAFGGDNSIANLRLLCRPCNQRQGIKLMGQRSFDQYLK
jgi:hypothetical protein